MWILIWSFLALPPVHNAGEAEWEKKFDTEADCVAYKNEHEKRMPDYFRGALNLGFGATVYVVGDCKKEPGVPA